METLPYKGGTAVTPQNGNLLLFLFVRPRRRAAADHSHTRVGEKMKNNVTATEHYDMLIDENCDPFRDGEMLKEYMKRWDGDAFYSCLNLNDQKTVLEIGVGTGRVARAVLDIGCKHLTGLDISPKTIARAKENLLDKYKNVELINQNIEDFSRPNYYDVAYSVLTFMHIENMQKALMNIVNALKPGGSAVLSISRQRDRLDYENRSVKLFPKEPEFYTKMLEKLGCSIAQTIDLIDTYIYPPTGEKSTEHGERIATIIHAVKK